MPTLATGPRSKRAAAAGFTLLEILVVLVIVAVVAGLAVFGVRDNPQQRLRREADQLAALLNYAADEAVLRGVELGLIVNDKGYRFVYYDVEKKQWQPLPDRALQGHAFAEPYEVSFALDGEHIDEKTLARIKNMSERGDEETRRPMLLVLSSGEMTPFRLTLRYGDAPEVTLSGDGFNPVVVQRG